MKALILVAVLSLTACASPPTAVDIARDAAAVNAALDLETRYQSAKGALTARLNDLPDAAALSLLELEIDADALVADIRALQRLDAWTLADIDRLYAAGEVLYTRGARVIAPQMAALAPAERQAVRELADAMIAIGRAVEQLKSDASASARLATLRAGIELATLTLKIGAALL